MLHSIGRYLDVLEEFKITPHQFMLPYILCLDKGRLMSMIRVAKQAQLLVGDTSTPAENTARYNSIVNPGGVQPWNMEDIDALVKGKALQPFVMSTGEDPNPTTRFRDAVFTHGGDFTEFYTTYPMHMPKSGDGRLYPTKGKDIDATEIEVLYRQLVPTRVEHEKVMVCLLWGIQHNMIQYKIDTFLKARVWWDLEKAMAEAQVHPEGHTRTKSGNTATSITF